MHQNEILVAISTNRQSDYATALGDTAIDKVVTFNSADVASHDATQITDEDKLGKGHDFPTEIQIESLDTKRNFSWDANSLNLPWALGFGLGSVVTTEVETGKVYSHVFKMSDPASTARQNPVTSIIEKIGAFETRKVPSLAVASVKLSGELKKRISLEVGLTGSGRILTSGVTAPTTDPATASYFTTAMCVLSMGLKGGSLTDAGADFHNFEVEINNNLQEELGYYPGSGFNTDGDPSTGAVRGRLEHGKRTVAMKLGVRVKSGSLVHQQLIAGTRLAMTLVATGAHIPGAQAANKYGFTLDIPDFAYKTMSIGQVGDGILLFTLEALPFYAAANLGSIKATVINDIASFLALAA